LFFIDLKTKMQEFLILGKKHCPYTEKVIDAMKNKKHEYVVMWSNVDFQDKEFKDLLGEETTYPQVYEIQANGKKKHLGGSDTTIGRL
jgi:glutaredoxin